MIRNQKGCSSTYYVIGNVFGNIFGNYEFYLPDFPSNWIIIIYLLCTKACALFQVGKSRLAHQRGHVATCPPFQILLRFLDTTI